MERKKAAGRPSKGLRHRTTLRLPEQLAGAAQQYAKRRGVSLNDLVGELLAAKVGVPYTSQEALPVNT